MKLVQTLKQKPTVSPQLILANRLLQFSSLELEQAIAQELAHNPALELRELQRCPACGAEMSAGACPTCGTVESWTSSLSASPSEGEEGVDHVDRPDEVSGVDPFVPPGGDEGGSYGGEWSDPVARLPSRTTLAEYLLRQARLSLPAEDVTIAHHVIGSLDDRGFLARDVDDLASDLGAEPGRVEEVLRVVQSLEPTGIAARNVRECLMIQMADLGSKRPGDGLPPCRGTVERSLAERLIRDHWDELAHSSLANLGREVDASVDEVRDALRFIRESLNPFPAHVRWAGVRGASSTDESGWPQPDVVIRESEAVKGGYEIELPKAGSYGLEVGMSYRRAMESLDEDNGSFHGQAWQRWAELRGRARLFVKSIEQRWQTLHNLAACLIECQREFLIHGERCLKPLTRAQVAEMMGVHESTVSRAVAGKYVELPCGRLVSMDTFFDNAAPVKHMIGELVDQEEGTLSDRAIAERLSEQGYHVSRRTVAKYRNALSILPSALRKRSRELCEPT